MSASSIDEKGVGESVGALGFDRLPGRIPDRKEEQHGFFL